MPIDSNTNTRVEVRGVERIEVRFGVPGPKGDTGPVDTTTAAALAAFEAEVAEVYVASEDVRTIVKIARAVYEALPSPDPTTLYIITD